MRGLEGKVAIVTGGGGRIGAATSSRLAEAGTKVVVADISKESAEAVAHGIGEHAIAVTFDAGDVAAIEKVVATAVAEFGRLDILHNNAALLDPAFMAGDLDSEGTSFEIWDKTMAVNVRGYLAACKFAIPHMRAAGGGSIINTTSNAGLLGDTVRIAYGSSKGAVIALTRYVATQHGRENIRCNAIAPGLIIDPELEARLPEFSEMTARHVLLPRHGRPEDMAALVAFFASDESSFLTGQIISCDGGALAHQPHFHDLLSTSG